MATTEKQIQKIYEGTVKFSCNNEHTNEEILQMLTERGYKNKTWGINLTGRGKQAEIKLCDKNDCIELIKTGIYDDKYKTTYIVEPAFDTNKTIITVFNVPLGASGDCIRQYLEDNNLKVTSHERQHIKYGDAAVYTGVIKYRCNKLDGFENLPSFETFYNNRKIGIRHSEQYDERNRVATEKQAQEDEDRERKREQKEIEQRNAERNKLAKELKVKMANEAKQTAEQKKEKERQMKADKNFFENALYNRLTAEQKKTAERISQNNIERKPTEGAECMRLSPQEFSERKEGYIQEEQIDMELTHSEEILDVYHPLNRISTEEPNGNESEQIEGIPEREEHEERETVIAEESATTENNGVDQTQTKEVDENEETASAGTGKVEENSEKEKEEEETSTVSKIEKIDEEIRELDEHYATTKDKIEDLGVQIVEQVGGIFVMLDTQKSNLDKMKDTTPETEEGEIVEVMDPRRRAKSRDGEVKETRLESKPGRSISETSTSMDFIDTENYDQLNSDKPGTNEQLSQSVISNVKKKRSKKEANMSTEEDLKEVDKKTKMKEERVKEEKVKEEKMKEENEVRRVRFGEFHHGYKNRDINSLRKRMESETLQYDDRRRIMLYLLLEDADTSRLGLTPKERVPFIAYTLYMNVGNYTNAMDSESTPKHFKSMWDNEILNLWEKLSKEQGDKAHVISKYKHYLTNINKKR